MDEKLNPVISQMVIYRVHPNDPDELKYNHAEELPAVITMVWADNNVNLKIFPDGPAPVVWKTSVLAGYGQGHWYPTWLRPGKLLQGG